MNTPADGWVTVHRQRDHRWRWAWSDGEGPELVSNETFETRDEARSAAQEAYPDAELRDEAAPAHVHDHRARRTGVVAALAVAFWAGRRSGVLHARAGTEGRRATRPR